jgi:hypothetical protein
MGKLEEILKSKVQSAVDEVVDKVVAEAVEEIRHLSILDFVGSDGGAPTQKRPGRRPVHKPSPQRQLQGKYMGMMRGLNATQKKQVKAVAKKNGFEAAIKAMEKGVTVRKPVARKAPAKARPAKDTAVAVANAFKKPRVIVKKTAKPAEAPSAPPSPPTPPVSA